MVLGQGEFTYRFDQGWGKLPKWWKIQNCSDVAIDSHERVYILDRGPHPVMVFERDGTFIGSWGEGGMFRAPHGIYIDKEDSVYATDFSTQQAMKFTCEGKVLLTLGNRDLPAGTFYGEPFNMPTGVSVAPSGNIFVSDGYGNHKVQKFSANGTLIGSWGKPGTGPGEFALVHNVDTDKSGRVYVCDRENGRIQIFDEGGKFITQWSDLHMPADIRIKGDVAYVAEQGMTDTPRISIFALDGSLLSRWGSEKAWEGVFRNPHGLWVDSEGVIYVCQVRVDGEPQVYTFTPAR
jgi:DNA-binding beta-propeller fold protein YncE